MESTESLSSNSGNPTPVMSELSLPEPVITGEHYMSDDIAMTADEAQNFADESVDVSRAGRKRKANTRYMEEPSPVAKPVSRRSSGVKKKPAAAVSSIVSPKSRTVSNKATSGSSTPAEDIPTGPPAFSQFLFKNRKGGRKMSEDTFSEEGEVEEEYLPEIVTSDDEEMVVEQQPKKSVARSTSRRSRPVEETEPEEKKMMEGVYVASGLIGPIDKIAECAKAGNVKIALQSPSTDKLPNVIPIDENGERIGFVSVPPPLAHVAIFAEIAGGPLALIPKKPVFWLRDEVPKLSAYFKKKMMGGEPAAPAPAVSKPAAPQPEQAPLSGSALVRKLSEEEKAAKRQKKEEERRKLIEDRAQRRERERLKQLYRQHWLALTKFPIDDNLLHSRKGIRRLGHAPSQCRQIATPIVYWDCLLGEPGTFEVPLDISPSTTALVDEIFVVWNFFNQFGSLMCPPSIRRFPSFTLPQLVQAFTTRECHPLIGAIHEWILEVLRPFALYEVDTLLAAEQAYESQLVKNRGRAKLFWPTFSEFRDFLFLGHCVLRNELKSNWLWLTIFLAKSIVVLDPVDPRRDFLASVSGAFEEIDFEHRWLFDLETNGSGFMYESIGFADRLRLVRILLNKISSLPWSKILIDKFCDARIHISSELVYIEKEERKSNQKIAHCQKLQSILSSGEPTAFPITLPLTLEELKSEIEFRDSLSAAKKIATTFVDSQLAVRLESIGKDRFFNEYFQISSMKKIVFVRQHSVTHTNVVRYGIYDSLSNLELLIQSLDDRGVREHALKAELQKIKASLFSDLVASADGEIDVNQKFCDWLSESTNKKIVEDFSVPVGPSQDSELVLAPLVECVDVAKEVMTMIRSVWFGLSHRKRKPRSFRTIVKAKPKAVAIVAAAAAAAPVVDEEAIEDDDDVTVEEEMSDVEPPEIKEEEKMEDEDVKEGSGDTTPLDEDGDEEEVDEEPENFEVNERGEFIDAISHLAETVSESINNSLFGFHKSDETTANASSVLIQFHIKNGNDFLRHLNIPFTEQDIERRIDGVIGSREKIVDFSAIILDGLLAMDEVVHDELARHEGVAEIWPISGGEKHAWRKFVGYFRDMEEEVVADGEEETERTTKGSFSCETCGKQFKYHILLGVHKLHPCKTRGRKPIPVEPIMDIKPVPLKNGMIAIEKMVLPSFPPPPSSRASVAAAAAVAATTAAVVPQEEGNTTGEYVCELCGKVFPHNQGLAVHQTRWCIPEQQAQLILTAQQAVGTVPSQGGEDGSPLPCPTCGKMFPTAQGLAIHLNRWCSGAMGDGSGTQATEAITREPPKVAVPIGPLFRDTSQAEKDKMLRVESDAQETAIGIEDEPRHPGYTPACYSLSAMSIAVLWYSNRLRAVLDSFTSMRSQPSRGGNKSKRK